MSRIPFFAYTVLSRIGQVSNKTPSNSDHKFKMPFILERDLAILIYFFTIRILRVFYVESGTLCGFL